MVSGGQSQSTAPFELAARIVRNTPIAHPCAFRNSDTMTKGCNLVLRGHLTGAPRCFTKKFIQEHLLLLLSGLYLGIQ